MEGVEEVQQIDDKHLHWKARIGGMTREWDAENLRAGPGREGDLAGDGGP